MYKYKLISGERNYYCYFNPTLQAQDAGDVLARLLPSTIAVLPRVREETAKKPHVAEQNYYEVKEPIVLKNVPIRMGGKTKVVAVK